MNHLKPLAGCSGCALGQAAHPGPCAFHEVGFAAGQMILRQGEEPECVWYVRQGMVLLSSTTSSGAETECSLRGPGTLIGLEAVAQKPTAYEAWALSDVILCRRDAPAFRAWMGDPRSPAGTVALLALQESMRVRRERGALTGSAHQRVARFLVERLTLEGADRPLPVEQQVLARMLGMKAETLSRAVARLRALGALAPGRGVRIADVAKLGAAAEPE